MFDEAFGTQEESARRIAEWLLVESLADLRHRSRDGASRYERLGISAILRRLLTDKHPVLAKARARLALPAPVFRYTPVPSPAEPVAGSMVLTISLGSIWSDQPAASSRLEGFLSASTGYSYPSAVTVLEVIRYFSHVYGGVHLFEPETRFEALVQRVAAAMPQMTGGYTETLVGLAKVVCDALDPIAAAIEADPHPISPADGDIEIVRRRIREITPLRADDLRRNAPGVTS